jgi:uncharacterized protein YbaP (TraB family)
MNRLVFCLILLTFMLRADDLPKPAAPGIVFKVEGGKAPLFLCGSIHLMQPKDFPLPEAYESAFKSSERVLMEVPPEEMDPVKMQPVLMKYALLKEGALEEKLSPATLKALQVWTKEKGLPIASFAKFQPWLVAISITQHAYEAFGMKAEHGIDMYFKNRLETEKKSSAGLETLDDQFRLLSGFSLEIQEKMILQSISEEQEANVELAKLLNGWRSGNTEAIAKSMAESFAQLPEVGKILLQDRNVRWARKIQELLTEPTPTMVLVGAGHLCGEGSLVQLIRNAGFQVTQVQAVRK